MACQGDIEREKRVRKTIEKYKEIRLELKRKIKDTKISAKERTKYMFELDKLPKDSSPIKARNRCALTGNAGAYFRFFKLGRHAFRKLAVEGDLPGVRKASW